MQKNKKQQGVTLIELVVAVAVLAIMVAVAVPSYQQMVAKSAIRSVSQDLRSALSEARAEALGQRKAITLTSTEGTCAGEEVEGWAHGWQFTTYTDEVHSWRVTNCHINVELAPAATELTFLRSGFYKKTNNDDKGAEFCVSSPRAKNYVHKISVGINGQVHVSHASVCN